VFSAGFAALLLARGRCPVIVSEHNSDFIEGRIRGRAAAIAHLVFRRSRLVCAVSTRLRDHLAAFEPAGRYEVVPNVVDVELFASSTHETGRAGSARLLTVATLAPQKGLEYLVQALAEARLTRGDVTLDLVGDGPCRASLEHLAGDMLPPGAITFHGARAREESAAMMAHSQVFVLPSVVETFGVVVIEALAAGMPIITTSAVPAGDDLPAGCARIVPPRDSSALAQAILALLESDRSPASEETRALVRSFSAPVVGQRWDAIYRSLGVAGEAKLTARR
jgi:glycosyltransferase involved in cell wall biosynthesis